MTIEIQIWRGWGGGNWGDFKKLQSQFGKGGGYFESRLPVFPDFGPQSLATLHNSIRAAASSRPGRFARIR